MNVLRLKYVACTVWLLAIGTGIFVLFNYEQAAGGSGPAAERWPSKTKVPLSPDRPTLVMFAHPKCPCTRASIEELNQLMAGYSSRFSTHVLFLRPSGMESDWTRTASWKSVASIPTVTVSEDYDGEEARHFGAKTSGHVVLYSPKGHLLFKGGITSARGHIGINAGIEMITSALNASKVQWQQTPVYGCSLLDECETSNE